MILTEIEHFIMFLLDIRAVKIIAWLRPWDRNHLACERVGVIYLVQTKRTFNFYLSIIKYEKKDFGVKYNDEFEILFYTEKYIADIFFNDCDIPNVLIMVGQ